MSKPLDRRIYIYHTNVVTSSIMLTLTSLKTPFLLLALAHVNVHCYASSKATSGRGISMGGATSVGHSMFGKTGFNGQLNGPSMFSNNVLSGNLISSHGKVSGNLPSVNVFSSSIGHAAPSIGLGSASSDVHNTMMQRRNIWKGSSSVGPDFNINDRSALNGNMDANRFFGSSGSSHGVAPNNSPTRFGGVGYGKRVINNLDSNMMPHISGDTAPIAGIDMQHQMTMNGFGFHGNSINANDFRGRFHGNSMNANDFQSRFHGNSMNANDFQSRFHGNSMNANDFQSRFHGNSMNANDFQSRFHGNSMNANDFQNRFHGNSMNANDFHGSRIMPISAIADMVNHMHAGQRVEHILPSRNAMPVFPVHQVSPASNSHFMNHNPFKRTGITMPSVGHFIRPSLQSTGTSSNIHQSFQQGGFISPDRQVDIWNTNPLGNGATGSGNKQGEHAGRGKGKSVEATGAAD